ncbi:MAG: hypothetical protein MRJ65_09190 [Candidatus Brocadiaceae bacterium]|nr:hypothetical protein [Candidatus Brocadiaceae bacterium]
MLTVKKTFQTISIALVVFFFAIVNLLHPVLGAWPGDPRINVAVCAASAQQSFPRTITDGAGGAIFAWGDTRNVHTDIYAQKIDSYGNIVWEQDGIPVCIAPENQDKPQIVSDGAGGVILAWQDGRSGDMRNEEGSYDIYVQHIGANGKILLPKNGLCVCNETNAQNSPAITSDGDGGAIIVWQDMRTNYADLFAQRIDKKGKPLWGENGVPVCIAFGGQGVPIAVEDGVGGAIVVWQDFRRTFADIYAQRIDGSGKILWDKNGVPICMARGHETFPALISDGAEGAIIVWNDTRNDARSNTNDIFIQHVDGNGAIQWMEDGMPVTIASKDQNFPVIASDGAGGAFIAWWDKRKDKSDVYAQHIDLTGEATWNEDGMGICVKPGIQNYVDIASDGAGGTIIVWNDNRNKTFDIYAQRIDSEGMVLWKDNGNPISAAANTQCYPTLVGDGRGGAIISWQDNRRKDDTYWDIYAQKINGKGLLSGE